jgi:hypothetical protein
MLIYNLGSLLFLAVLSIALLAFGFLALRNSAATIAVLIMTWIVTTALRDSLDLSVTLSSIRIALLDVLSLILLVIGVARCFSLGVRTVGRGLALALVFLVGAHVVRGIIAFGFQIAINNARGWIYFSAALIYAATVPGSWNKRSWQVFAIGGLLLAIIAVPYLLVDGLHSSSAMVLRNGMWVTARPIVATGALLILQSVVLVLGLSWPSTRAAMYLAIGAGAVIVLLEHRTLWVAGLAIAFVGFVSWSARRVGEAESLVFATTGIVLLLLPFAVWAFTRSGPLVASARETTSSNSTLTWRTTGWRELISSHHSGSELTVGAASGSSMNRQIDGKIVDLAPHNGFVEAYLRFGLPGVLILCWLGLLLWRRRALVAGQTGLTPETVGLLLIAQLVFSLTYSLDAIQGAIDGILISGLVMRGTMNIPVSNSTRSPEPRYGLVSQ